jgi:NDP-sugar pyrophosphorylase family protein
MIPVAGRPFLDWILLYLQEQGISEVVISAGHLGNVIAGRYRQRTFGGVAITVVQEPQPLGTAGGFLYALRHTNAEHVLVVNGDSLAIAPLCQFIACQGSVDAAVLGVLVDDATRYGLLDAGSGGRLIGFQEKRPGVGLVNAGVYLFRRETVEMFPRKTPLSFETDVFPVLIAAGCVIRVCPSKVPFLDIGTPASLAAATDFIDTHFATRANQ